MLCIITGVALQLFQPSDIPINAFSVSCFGDTAHKKGQHYFDLKAVSEALSYSVLDLKRF